VLWYKDTCGWRTVGEQGVNSYGPRAEGGVYVRWDGNLFESSTGLSCRTGPTERGAGVRTPFYCFAWRSGWSRSNLLLVHWEATPRASARNEVAASRGVGSSGRIGIEHALRNCLRTCLETLEALGGARGARAKARFSGQFFRGLKPPANPEEQKQRLRKSSASAKAKATPPEKQRLRKSQSNGFGRARAQEEQKQRRD
jgi:hypothetical protein